MKEIYELSGDIQKLSTAVVNITVSSGETIISDADADRALEAYIQEFQITTNKELISSLIKQTVVDLRVLYLAVKRGLACLN